MEESDMPLKMPSVTVAFKEAGITAIERSERGIVLLICEEASAKAPYIRSTFSTTPCSSRKASSVE